MEREPSGRPGLFPVGLWGVLGILSTVRLFVASDATGRWLVASVAVLAFSAAAVAALQRYRHNESTGQTG